MKKFIIIFLISVLIFIILYYFFDNDLNSKNSTALTPKCYQGECKRSLKAKDFMCNQDSDCTIVDRIKCCSTLAINKKSSSIIKNRFTCEMLCPQYEAKCINNQCVKKLINNDHNKRYFPDLFTQ